MYLLAILEVERTYVHLNECILRIAYSVLLIGYQPNPYSLF